MAGFFGIGFGKGVGVEHAKGGGAFGMFLGLHRLQHQRPALGLHLALGLLGLGRSRCCRWRWPWWLLGPRSPLVLIAGQRVHELLGRLIIIRDDCSSDSSSRSLVQYGLSPCERYSVFSFCRYIRFLGCSQSYWDL